ncbi:hypothetical protein PHMEG_00015472 [Phytophthora megakarya]|uniref:Uncharacterized protein n=1 Tax=Phytophthora megakarya TaxID=4795 RepID=A0A225W3R7_9STRA|nr:hypothetical protein PHMEG_00015472 [Phytophthora megakarya]
MKSLARQTHVESFAGLYEWASIRNCTTEDKFFGPDKDGKQEESFGLIMISRRIFRIVKKKTVFSQLPTELKSYITVGGCWLHWVRTDLISIMRFLPWAYMFVRTKLEYAYEQLFRMVVNYAQLFFKLQLNGSLDHAARITNAFKNVCVARLLPSRLPKMPRKDHPIATK